MNRPRDEAGRRRLPPLADAVASTLVALLLLFVAFGGWTSEQALRNGPTTHAQVTDVHGGRYPSYDVRFTTTTGATVVEETSFALEGARPGDTIQVVYDPDYPDTVGQVGSLGTAWLQWVGWLGGGILGVGYSTVSWRRVIRNRRARLGRHASPDPRGDRLRRRAGMKETSRRWRPIAWRIVLGLPVPQQDHAFAMTRAQEVVDRLPQSWAGYLVFLVGAFGAVAGIFPLAQFPLWLQAFAAIGIVIFLVCLVIALRIQWWHRKNRPERGGVN